VCRPVQVGTWMIIISRRWRLPLLLIGSSGRGDSSGCCETTTNRLAAISAPKFVSLTRVRPIASSGKTHHADRRSQKATTRRPNAADTMMTEASTLTIEQIQHVGCRHQESARAERRPPVGPEPAREQPTERDAECQVEAPVNLIRATGSASTNHDAAVLSKAVRK